MTKTLKRNKKQARDAVRRLRIQKKQADKDLKAAMEILSLAGNEERLLDPGY